MAVGRRRTPISRRFVTWLLRSPFSGLLDRNVMLVTLRGRRTGAERTLPVQYAEHAGAIWVLPGNPERKRWWRNLSAESPVTLQLRRRTIRAKGQAFTGGTDPSIVEEGLEVYVRRFGAVGRRMKILDREGRLDGERLREMAKDAVIVRITTFPA